jgi:hypothetical protein
MTLKIKYEQRNLHSRANPRTKSYKKWFFLAYLGAIYLVKWKGYPLSQCTW